jgi:hypothetical protein
MMWITLLAVIIAITAIVAYLTGGAAALASGLGLFLGGAIVVAIYLLVRQRQTHR